MIVAGIMSGTSADGVDVAIVRITATQRSRDKSPLPKIKLLAHSYLRYPKAVRAAVLAAMNAECISVRELSLLHTRLGGLYAEAIQRALARYPARLDLIGLHGQTIYHQGNSAPFLGERIATTWQMGEPSILSERLGVPVVSDFRPADIAAGGQGAPLVPLLDYAMFRNPRRTRILQNLGGIANLTAIPPAAGLEDLIAFDTGPANMVIDALAQRLFDRAYDAGGRIAASGLVLESVLNKFQRLAFFRQPPPKTAGREQFGVEFVSRFLADCRKTSKLPQDAVATATALTARSISNAIREFILPRLPQAPIDYVASGGGARNGTLMRMLHSELEPMGFNFLAAESLGLPAMAKEAAAFALLAWQTWSRLPGNVPVATGARHPVILGRITYV